jgi:hypothetical protein
MRATAGLARHSPTCQTAAQQAQLARTERYMSSVVFSLIVLMFLLMCGLYIKISGLFWPAILAVVILSSISATVSGNRA